MVEDNYDGVIVVARNWRGYPLRHKPFNGRLDIHPLSKINCIVGAEMYLSGRARKIILGTGKTAGEEWPSEASAMRDYMLKKYGEEIREEDILIQEKSLESYGELNEDYKLARENGLEKLAVITLNSQLPKSRKILGNKVDYISSEEEIKKTHPRYERLLRNYQNSWAYKYEMGKESFLSVLHYLGVRAWFTKRLARLFRG